MKRQQLATIVMAILMAGSMGAIGTVSADYTAPPSADTSGTDDTGSVSEVQPGDTLGANHTFEANSTKNKTIQWISDSNETKAEIYRNGSSHIAYSDNAPTTVLWNSTAGDGHYNTTVSHAELLDVEHGAGENVTMYMEFTDNTSLSEENQSVGNSTFYVEYDNSTSVKTVSDASADDSVTVENESGPLGLTIATLGTDHSEIEASDRTVNGSQTDLYVTFSDSNVSDDFSRPAEDASAGEKLSGFSLNRNVVLLEDGDGNIEPVRVYHEEAPDDLTEDDTFAVYGTHGGSDGIMVNLGSDYDDASTVSVTAKGGVDLGTDLGKYVTNSATSVMG